MTRTTPAAIALLVMALPACSGPEPEPAPVACRGTEIGSPVSAGPVVFVQAVAPSLARCVGVMLSPRVALTAGHCLSGRTAWEVTAEDGKTAASDDSANLFPRHVPTDERVNLDLGLIHLSTPIVLAAYATVPTGPSAYSDGVLVSMRSGGELTDSWHAHRVQLWPGGVLSLGGFRYGLGYITDRVASEGDSGSPVFLPGTLTVAGVLASHNGCGNVVARTDLAAAWIGEFLSR